MASRTLEIWGHLERAFPTVLTNEAIAPLEALAGLDADRKTVLAARIARRAARARGKRRIEFLDPTLVIPRTTITVQQARAKAAKIPAPA